MLCCTKKHSPENRRNAHGQSRLGNVIDLASLSLASYALNTFFLTLDAKKFYCKSCRSSTDGSDPPKPFDSVAYAAFVVSKQKKVDLNDFKDEQVKALTKNMN
jgi:hypothetical protein